LQEKQIFNNVNKHYVDFCINYCFFPVRETATSSKELKSMSRELDEIPEEFRTNEIIVKYKGEVNFGRISAMFDRLELKNQLQLKEGIYYKETAIGKMGLYSVQGDMENIKEV